MLNIISEKLHSAFFSWLIFPIVLKFFNSRMAPYKEDEVKIDNVTKIADTVKPHCVSSVHVNLHVSKVYCLRVFGVLLFCLST